MTLVETEWWTLELPEEWDAEQDDDVIVIEDEDGVSSIEVSALLVEEGEVDDEDLAEFSRDLSDEGLTPTAVRIGAWRGLLFVHGDDESHAREWFLRQGAHFVYFAHYCLPEHAGMDDGAVDEILSTLTAREPDQA